MHPMKELGPALRVAAGLRAPARAAAAPAAELVVQGAPAVPFTLQCSDAMVASVPPAE